jgi:hypothetical protein
MMADYALFINGVFRKVLDDIRFAQESDPDLILYLQPYSGAAIKRLAVDPPSQDNPVRLFISTSTALMKVSYTCEIVGWDDKTLLRAERKDEIEKVIRKYQTTEDGLYMHGHSGGPEARNLLHVRSIQRFSLPFSVEKLIKLSDGSGYSPHRATSGGWSYVKNPDPDFLFKQLNGFSLKA